MTKLRLPPPERSFDGLPAAPTFPQSLGCGNSGDFYGDNSSTSLFSTDIVVPLHPSLEALRMGAMAPSKTPSSGRKRRSSAHTSRCVPAGKVLLPKKVGKLLASSALGTPSQKENLPDVMLTEALISPVSPKSEWASNLFGSDPADSVVSKLPVGRSWAEVSQNLDSRQLVKCCEKLHGELEKLQRENSTLQITLNATKAELQTSIEKCDELSGLAARGDTDLDENTALRKQLSAYAVEIEVLREEQTKKDAAIRESHEALQRLSIEREGFVKSLQDLDWSHSEQTERVRHLERLLEERATQHNVARQQLQSARNELAYRDTSLQATPAPRILAEKDALIDALVDVVEAMREQLSTMQEPSVALTREFGDFVKGVRFKLFTHADKMDTVAWKLDVEGKQLNEFLVILDQLNTQYENFCSTHKSTSQSMLRVHEGLREQISKHQSMQQVAERAAHRAEATVQKVNLQWEVFDFNRDERSRIMKDAKIVPQMFLACHEGAVLIKVGDKSAKKEHRKVWLCEDTMCMRWLKYPLKPGQEPTNLLLSRITHISFGCLTRAHILFPESPPWLCFSVHTLQRSYDFICRDQKEVEAFMLSISRLCSRIAWPVPGSVPTRRQFLALSGWCKVEHLCRRENKSFVAALLDVLLKVGAPKATLTRHRNFAKQRRPSHALPQKSFSSLTLGLLSR